MEIYERKSISMSCTSVNRPNKRLRWRNSPPLILYMKKEKAKEEDLGGRKGISVYDCIDFADISSPS